MLRSSFSGALVEVAAAAQPAQRSVTPALGDLGNVVLRARRRLLEAYAVVWCLEDAKGGERSDLPAGVKVRSTASPSPARARVRDGVVLVDRPELHVPRETRARWLDWLAGLAGTRRPGTHEAGPADATPLSTRR